MGFKNFPFGLISFPFAAALLVGVSAWILVNVLAPRLGIAAFDPFPFPLLVGVIGLAALLATDASYLKAWQLQPRDFAGAIGIAGPYDFLPLTDPKLIEVFGPDKDWPLSQPIHFVDGDEPPFLLMQGSADRVVKPRNAVALADALKAVDVAVTLRPYADIGHFRILAGVRYPTLAPTLGDVVHFVTNTAAIAPQRCMRATDHAKMNSGTTTVAPPHAALNSRHQDGRSSGAGADPPSAAVHAGEVGAL